MNLDSEELNKWVEEIEQLKEKVRNAAIKSDRLIAFYGSSSIRMWENISDDLQPYQVINLGFGGSSYYWCNYFQPEVFDNFSPKQVILYAGDNDLGSETPENEIINNLASLVDKFKSHLSEIGITVISVKPSPERHYLKDKIESLNAKIKDLMHSVEGDYIDIYSRMLSDQGDYRSELFLEDQLHMNELGYEIWQREILQYLNESSLTY
ncbi:GDSL-type esterase/lipase family protein [Ekhidna sp.]